MQVPLHSPSFCRERAGTEGTLHCSLSLQPLSTSQPGREVSLEHQTPFCLAPQPT